MGKLNYRISTNDCGGRLDGFLTDEMGDITRSQISNAIKNGGILVNGGRVKCGYILRAGDEITGEIKTEPITATPENIPLQIVYEDPCLIVLNKPRGMVVHTGAGVKSGTVLNALLWRNTSGGGSADGNGAEKMERCGIVHRLDKNTAGLLLVAKTAEAQAKLSKMFERHEIKRTYIGILEGVVSGDMTIDKNIIRHPKARTLFTTTATGGRRAVTHLTVLERYRKYSLCRFNLETGRTHQIRVHCKSINHAIVGDAEYNPNGTIKRVSGQMLEAVKLEFTHPLTGKDIKIEINPSKQLTETITKCKVTV